MVTVDAVAETIRAISLGLRDTVRKPTETALFDNYGRLCMVVDEVINEVCLSCYSLLKGCAESAKSNALLAGYSRGC